MMTKIFLSILPFLLLVPICSSKSDDIAVYWGQNVEEGNLTETCATGIYSFVLLARLLVFGSGETPQLYLGYHCSPSSSSGCAAIGTEIKYCQHQGIKVMLSLDGGYSSDAAYLADYLRNNFLGGNSSSRPLGDAILDGMDFNLTFDPPNLQLLASFRKSYGLKVHLSALLGCLPNVSPAPALATGHFDYIWVQFYDNPTCAYSEDNINGFFYAWNKWTTYTSLNRSKVFLGLPASEEEAAFGYVPADLLISKVLPTVKKYPYYGGVMLWSRYQDRLSGYSTNLQIGLLCTPQIAPKCRNHDSGFRESFGYMSTESIKVYESENLGGQCCETICWNNCSCEAYAPLNQANKTGCQIWLEGSKLTEDAGSKGQSIYIVKHKGKPCFLTCRSL